MARRAAIESIVLLKNSNGMLPLRTDPASILVVGPTAASVGVLLGNYYGVSSRLVTLVEGIVGRVSEGTRATYRPGCPLVMPGAPGINYTFSTAADSEVVVAVMGLDPTLEGEEGDTVASPTGGDRPVIELPENQRAFLRELRLHSKKLVLVLTGGSAIAVPEEHEMCDAVLQVWYPGCEGGTAVAQVLFGDFAPSGRMPVTVPRSTADLPPFDDYHMRGRTYRFAEVEPLYPFGFGLGFEPVEYERIDLDRTTLEPGDGVTVRAVVRNRGRRATEETVQCYVIPPRDRPHAPTATLVAFEKVSIPPGGSVEVTFDITDGCFHQYDTAGQRVRVPGRFEIVVGPCSPGRRGQELGAPMPLRAPVELSAFADVDQAGRTAQPAGANLGSR
jgi:beta-glucosidase